MPEWITLTVGFLEIGMAALAAWLAWRASKKSTEAADTTVLTKRAVDSRLSDVLRATTAEAHASGRLLRAEDIRGVAARLVNEAGETAEQIIRDAQAEAFKIRFDAMQEAVKMRSEALRGMKEEMAAGTEKLIEKTAVKLAEKSQNGDRKS